MYKSMNAEDNFSQRGSVSSTASLEVRSDNSASSWISMLTAVSRPAWSLLLKYLPGKPQTWSSEAEKSNVDFGHKLMAGLDSLMPPDQSPTRLRINGGFITSGDVETLRWLTTDSLRELGIQDNMNIHFQQTAPIEYRSFTSIRTFLSRFLAPKEGKQTESMQPKIGVCYPGPTTSTWWWQGLWNSDHPQNTLPAVYQTQTPANDKTTSPHCRVHRSSCHCKVGCQMSAVAVEQWGHDTQAEWTCSECAGHSCYKESVEHSNHHTAGLEFLSKPDCLPSAHDEHGAVACQFGTRASATCSEATVLTPDQDNGYSSLEEEGASARQCNMNTICELLDRDGSAASQAGDHGHGGEEDKSAGNAQCERVENKEENKEESVQNTESVIVHETLPVQSSCHCPNKAIAYIMGSPCSDESDMEDSSVFDTNDDDGFDSDSLESCSDSEDPDDSDDEEDDEDSESDELDSDSERLWNSLCQTGDPYNPRSFTAPIRTSKKLSSESTAKSCPVGSPVVPESLLCSSPSSVPSSLDGTQKDMESGEDACSSTDEAESLRLWNSFSCSLDPYSPLNFRAPISTQQSARPRRKKAPPVEPLVYRKEDAEERMDSGFSEAAVFQAGGRAGVVRLKKVTFIEEVEEFYASSDEERHGPWEEYARDRCRFRRRVQEVEESIGYCLSPSFRLKVFQSHNSSRIVQQF